MKYKVFLAPFLALPLNLAQAASGPYQIDLLVFAEQEKLQPEITSFHIPQNLEGRALNTAKSESGGTYQLLPSSLSLLKREAYTLSHRPEYETLLHYSWIQPGNNTSAVVISAVENKGWVIRGKVRVRQSNFYFFNADLSLSPVDQPNQALLIHENRRLKENNTYYLDHPEVAMLIRIKPFSPTRSP